MICRLHAVLSHFLEIFIIIRDRERARERETEREGGVGNNFKFESICVDKINIQS